jgi:tetratricopeptide (TPR) repeat protein
LCGETAGGGGEYTGGMRILVLSVLGAFLGLAGCSAGRTVHHESTDTEGSSYGGSLTLHRNPDEAKLDRGKQYVMESRFDEAASLFREVADKASAKAEYRETALFELAELHANVLNPHRNPREALKLFRRFVDAYPDSKLADRARDQIDRLEGGD